MLLFNRVHSAFTDFVFLSNFMNSSLLFPVFFYIIYPELVFLHTLLHCLVQCKALYLCIIYGHFIFFYFSSHDCNIHYISRILPAVVGYVIIQIPCIAHSYSPAPQYRLVCMFIVISSYFDVTPSIQILRFIISPMNSYSLSFLAQMFEHIFETA